MFAKNNKIVHVYLIKTHNMTGFKYYNSDNVNKL